MLGLSWWNTAFQIINHSLSYKNGCCTIQHGSTELQIHFPNVSSRKMSAVAKGLSKCLPLRQNGQLDVFTVSKFVIKNKSTETHTRGWLLLIKINSHSIGFTWLQSFIWYYQILLVSALSTLDTYTHIHTLSFDWPSVPAFTMTINLSGTKFSIYEQSCMCDHECSESPICWNFLNNTLFHWDITTTTKKTIPNFVLDGCLR